MIPWISTVNFSHGNTCQKKKTIYEQIKIVSYKNLNLDETIRHIQSQQH